MNNQENKGRFVIRKENIPLSEALRRIMPFFVEFIRFTTAFAAIIAVALITLNVASAALQ